MAWAAVSAAGISLVGGMVASNSANKASKKLNNQAEAQNALQMEIDRDAWERYQQIYEPLERDLVSEASNYDSDENYQRAAGDASATVSQQFGKARDRLTRTPGMDPSSAAYQAGMTGLDLAQAATDAVSQNAARDGVRDTAYTRKVAALGMGKGLDTAASNGAGSSARNSLALADYANRQASNTAGAIGRITDRVFSAIPTGGAKPAANSPGLDYVEQWA